MQLPYNMVLHVQESPMLQWFIRKITNTLKELKLTAFFFIQSRVQNWFFLKLGLHVKVSHFLHHPTTYVTELEFAEGPTI